MAAIVPSLLAAPKPLICPITLHSPFKCSIIGRTQTYHLASHMLFFSPTKQRFTVVAIQAASTGKSSGAVRFRLHNLGPQTGAKKKRKRTGRGNSAGQGNSCGYGTKGQKARSTPGIKRQFEGGQNPLCKRIPKLRGARNRKSVKKFIAVNLKSIDAANFREGEEVSLRTLKEKRVIRPTGRSRKLPLKILGDGDVSLKLNVKARAFSKSASEKLRAAGCTVTKERGPKKWMRPSILRNLARAREFWARKKAEAAAAKSSTEVTSV